MPGAGCEKTVGTNRADTVTVRTERLKRHTKKVQITQKKAGKGEKRNKIIINVGPKFK